MKYSVILNQKFFCKDENLYIFKFTLQAKGYVCETLHWTYKVSLTPIYIFLVGIRYFQEKYKPRV